MFGPEGIRNYLNASFRTADLQFTYGLRVQEFPRGFRGRVLDETELHVDALPLDHSIFCLGWRLQEKTRPGTFDLEEAQALGIPRGPMYGRLQDGESVTLPDGRVIKPEMVLGAPRPGKSVVYCLDTQFSERSIELADKLHGTDPRNHFWVRRCGTGERSKTFHDGRCRASREGSRRGTTDRDTLQFAL